MSGRHRRAAAASARRALAGTVPVLGLAGVVTAAVGSAPDSTPEAVGSSSLVTTPIPAPGTVALDQQDLGIGPDITTVAADAAKAAGQAGEEQREQERRSIVAVVDGVRDDARARAAAADREGQAQLDAFQRDQEQARKAQERQQEQERSTVPAPDGTAPDDRSCTSSGFPFSGTDGDEIVGRDCGLLDLFGQQRSSDPWIDGQLLQSRDD